MHFSANAHKGLKQRSSFFDQPADDKPLQAAGA